MKNIQTLALSRVWRKQSFLFQKKVTEKMADSDSENEGILTNIQRLVIRPPGHTGKAKKGHVCFDGSHETMNLGRVDFITNQVPIL